VADRVPEPHSEQLPRIPHPLPRPAERWLSTVTPRPPAKTPAGGCWNWTATTCRTSQTSPTRADAPRTHRQPVAQLSRSASLVLITRRLKVGDSPGTATAAQRRAWPLLPLIAGYGFPPGSCPGLTRKGSLKRRSPTWLL
jgi:hypothetical protein